MPSLSVSPFLTFLAISFIAISPTLGSPLGSPSSVNSQYVAGPGHNVSQYGGYETPRTQPSNVSASASILPRGNLGFRDFFKGHYPPDAYPEGMSEWVCSAYEGELDDAFVEAGWIAGKALQVMDDLKKPMPAPCGAPFPSYTDEWNYKAKLFHAYFGISIDREGGPVAQHLNEWEVVHRWYSFIYQNMAISPPTNSYSVVCSGARGRIALPPRDENTKRDFEPIYPPGKPDPPAYLDNPKCFGHKPHKFTSKWSTPGGFVGWCNWFSPLEVLLPDGKWTDCLHDVKFDAKSVKWFRAVVDLITDPAQQIPGLPPPELGRMEVKQAVGPKGKLQYMKNGKMTPDSSFPVAYTFGPEHVQYLAKHKPHEAIYNVDSYATFGKAMILTRDLNWAIHQSEHCP